MNRYIVQRRYSPVDTLCGVCLLICFFQNNFEKGIDFLTNRAYNNNTVNQPIDLSTPNKHNMKLSIADDDFSY